MVVMTSMKKFSITAVLIFRILWGSKFKVVMNTLIEITVRLLGLWAFMVSIKIVRTTVMMEFTTNQNIWKAASVS